MIAAHEIGRDASEASSELSENKEHGDEIVGVYIIAGARFKKRIHGKIESSTVFKSDEERLEALKKYFGMDFIDREKEAIKGLPSAIADLTDHI